MASSRAQNVNDKLFGGEYTYIEFVATKPHQYPVCFAALSTKDTIKIDRSNLKAFIKPKSVIRKNRFHFVLKQNKRCILC